MQDTIHQNSPSKQPSKPVKQTKKVNKAEETKQFEKMETDKQTMLQNMDKFTLAK